MSFQGAEATNATLNGIAAILRMVLEEPGYSRNPHQVYDNMDSDPLIDMLPTAGKPASHVELLQHVQNHRTNPPAIPDEVVIFCRANLQHGPLLPAPGSATLGRVQSMRSLVNAVADPASALSLRNAEALVRDVVAGAPDPATKLAKQRFEFAGRNLSRYQMWCYPAADSRDPFHEIGTTRAEAVNILGLGYYAFNEPTAEIVRWAHTLPGSIQAHRPTAWDAGADKGNVHWRPGGSTYQLDRNDFGLSEMVHNPVTGENLVAPVEALS
jgi:hypothetical protein